MTTDDVGRETRYTLDETTGLRRQVTYPDGTAEVVAYNGFNQIERFVDREGRVTTATFDATGNTLTKTVGQALDGSGSVISTGDTATLFTNSYNADGQVIAES